MEEGEPEGEGGGGATDCRCTDTLSGEGGAPWKRRGKLWMRRGSCMSFTSLSNNMCGDGVGVEGCGGSGCYVIDHMLLIVHPGRTEQP